VEPTRWVRYLHYQLNQPPVRCRKLTIYSPKYKHSRLTSFYLVGIGKDQQVESDSTAAAALRISCRSQAYGRTW